MVRAVVGAAPAAAAIITGARAPAIITGAGGMLDVVLATDVVGVADVPGGIVGAVAS